MDRLNATEVAARFAEVLNRVAAGEEIEVTRGDVTVAVIAPPQRRVLSAHRFRELMASTPPVDDHFAADLRRIRHEAGTVPRQAWPS